MVWGGDPGGKPPVSDEEDEDDDGRFPPPSKPADVRAPNPAAPYSHILT